MGKKRVKKNKIQNKFVNSVTEHSVTDSLMRAHAAKMMSNIFGLIIVFSFNLRQINKTNLYAFQPTRISLMNNPIGMFEQMFSTV